MMEASSESRLLVPGTDTIPVECCRECSRRFEFLLPDGEVVTVLCGQPCNTAYKAVSYLWEETQLLVLKCRKCSATKRIPMRDPQKLWNLLGFVRGSNIWLDAMSIDQDSGKDLNEQLDVMGEIYNQAQTVSVLLPAVDKEAYEMLKRLAVTSNEILQRCAEFGVHVGDEVAPPPGFHHTINELADQYFQMVSEWDKNISKWRYWGRAWTFQEWTMASEIEISWEGFGSGGMTGIKNIIVSASSIIGQWKVREAKTSGPAIESLSSQLRMRTYVSHMRNLVRTHFPFEDFLAADEEESLEVVRTMTSLSSIHSINSGTSVHLSSVHQQISSLRRLLSLALNAINTSVRKTRYDADLIACWASMCNISYSYDKDDSFNVALYKVVTALRKDGITIYNFMANIYGGEVDLNFMQYAAAMKQSNLATDAYMLGCPIFVGRADTLTHIKHCLSQIDVLEELPCSFDVTLQKVRNAVIGNSIPCSEPELLLSKFRSLVTGTVGGEINDVVALIGKQIMESSSCKPEQLESRVLIPVSISCEDSRTTWDFDTWGICPSHMQASNMIVARESLNGTMVLANPTGRGTFQIVAYLNMTHQRHGTYLVKSDKEGVVDIVFRKPDPGLRETLASLDLSGGLSDLVGQGFEGPLTAPDWGLMDAMEEARNVKISLAEIYSVAPSPNRKTGG